MDAIIIVIAGVIVLFALGSLFGSKRVEDDKDDQQKGAS